MVRRASVLLLFGVLLPGLPSSFAQEQQYELSRFDVTVQVHPDGTYDVEETIAYDFQRGSFTYAYRSIVQEEAGAVRDVRVTSPDTPVDSVSLAEEDDVRQVRWTFPARSEPAQFDIHYTLEDAIYARGDRNVVSLDVMADEADVPTRNVNVRVTLPGAFDLREDQIVVEPAGGEVRRDGGRLVAHFHRDVVEEGDAFTVEVSFPKQVPGQFLPTAGDLLFACFLMALGIGGGTLAFWTWRGPRPEVEAQRPPSDVDLPTAAVLLHNRGGHVLFPAVLFDLVRRGHLTLQHDREERLLGTREHVRLDVHPERADLTDFEKSFLDRLREYDTLDEFWSNTRSFRKEAVDAHRKELIDRCWMERHTTRSTLLMLFAVAALTAGIAAIVTEESAPRFFALFGGLGLSIGGFIAAIRRHTWTAQGARRGMALRSFLEHEKSEIDRLRDASPARAAERLVDSLPWLVLHDDVSKAWIEKMEEDLEAAGAVPDIPPGFRSLVAEGEDAAAASAAFLPVVGVMAAMESTGAGAAGAAGGGAAAGGAGGAGAAGAG